MSAARVSGVRGGICREVCNSAKLHPALTYTRPFMSARTLQILTFRTEHNVHKVLVNLNLKSEGKCLNCFWVDVLLKTHNVLFKEASFIILFHRHR